LSTVVNAAVELCRPTMAAANQSFTQSLPSDPVFLDADQVRLTQVLVNLLNNAVKFTPANGHIWLIADTATERGDRQTQLLIRVRDTGIGIAPPQLPFIFDMFVQGDTSLERTRAGLGVGLTLVQKLVSLHGGSIEAHSDGPGTGSEFTVRLPLDPGAQLPVQSATPPASTGAVPALRILVADDNDDGREMLTFLLTDAGHTVHAAADGLEAVALAERFPLDVAILDIGMPGMNGYDVAQALQARSGAPPITLVALSGLGQAEDKERAAQAGFDRHFTKPVDANALRAFLATAPLAGRH
jgi:CheY-like chemotaxis protein